MDLSLDRIARPFVTFVERFYPDAFVFALLLTGVTLTMSVVLTPTSAVDAVRIWGDGLSGLLSFITQVALTLVCAHALAHTDIVTRAIERLAALPRTPPAAYALVALVAGIASLVAWSLGLVVGALAALAVGRSGRAKGLRLHFPLLVASAYAGFTVWHMGYSSTAALFVATPGHALEGSTGIVPATQTIFAPWNLALAVLALALIAFVCSRMGPRDDAEIAECPHDEATSIAADSEVGATRGLGSALDHARWLSTLGGLLFLAWLVQWFAAEGLRLTLNVVNWSFLGLGLLLARSPVHYVALILNASRALGPIVLQYPFYAGIMGLITNTGLVDLFSDGFVEIASRETLGFWAFVSGGVLNFFVPSGGGQWAVQGPIFVAAAKQLGTPIPEVVMGVAYGDQWTNLIQPFWTLPLLAIAGLNARSIMGYCLVVFLATGVLFGGGLLLVGAHG